MRETQNQGEEGVMEIEENPRGGGSQHQMLRTNQKEIERLCVWQDGSLPGETDFQGGESTREVKEETRSKDYKDTFIICTESRPVFPPVLL